MPEQDTTAIVDALWEGTGTPASLITEITSLDGTVSYSYDSAGQLLAATYTAGQAAEVFSYDAAGNRTTANGAAYLTGPNNQLLFDGIYSYLYDPEGNRTARFIDSNANGLLDAGDTAATTYAWDHRNRLTRVTDYDLYGDPATRAIDYLYDTENRWIGRDVDLDADGQIDTRTRFAYDGNQIVMQFDRSTATTGDPTDPRTVDDLSHRYLWNPAAVDQLMADEQVTNPAVVGDIVWPLGDHQGTIRDLAAYDPATDATTIVNHRAFDAYGNLQSQTSTNPAHDTLFAFTGRPLDQTTGLQNNLHRWYDPAVGRWMSEDPVGFEGGDENLYEYVGNNPINASDPTGLEVYTGWKEPVGGILRINWINAGNWQVEGDVWTSGGDVLEDQVARYARTAREFTEPFVMTFQFKFEGGYVRGKRSNGELLPDAPGFVPNSGVYIYNAIEVAIFDTNALLKMLKTVEADGTVRIKIPGSRTDTVWKVLTGVPYGVASETREGYDESWLRTKNPLKPAGQWNEMTIRFTPFFLPDAPGSEGKKILLWYKLEVYVNGTKTYDDWSNRTTKEKGQVVVSEINEKPWFNGFYIYLQSHWGSQVSFRNMVIKTGNDM